MDLPHTNPWFSDHIVFVVVTFPCVHSCVIGLHCPEVCLSPSLDRRAFLLFNQMAISQQEEVGGQSQPSLASALALTDSVHCFFFFPRSPGPEKRWRHWTKVPRTPRVRSLWGVCRVRRGVAVAVRGAHQRLEEREEARAWQVPGTRVTWRSCDRENGELFFLREKPIKDPVVVPNTTILAANRK